MIHTKSLIRRLAYVPWLLAFGLVLGWAGEAQAQSVKLAVDKTEVREDGGAVTIKVTATTFNAAGAAAALGAVRYVQLKQASLITLEMAAGDTPDLNTDETAAPGTQVNAYGLRFTMTLPTIVIPAAATSASVDVVFTPIPVNHENDETKTLAMEATLAAALRYVPEDRIPNDDVVIQLMGDSGGVVTIAENPKPITMLDTDKASTLIRLSLNPKKISKEADETPVTVTGSLSGRLVNNKTLSFLLRQTDPSGGQAVAAGRDADYDIRVSTLSIQRKKPSGDATIYVDPKNNKIGFIGITSEAELEITHTDINNDGDVRDVFTAYANAANQTEQPIPVVGGDDIVGGIGATITFTEVGLNANYTSEGAQPVALDDVFTVTPELVDHDNDEVGETGLKADDMAATAERYRYVEANVNTDGETGNEGFDLNGDGDTLDTLEKVEETKVLHPLTIALVDFQIDDTKRAGY